MTGKRKSPQEIEIWKLKGEIDKWRKAAERMARLVKAQSEVIEKLVCQEQEEVPF